MSTAPSPTQSSSPSPGKGTSVKDFTRERLEKLFTDSVRKLKAKEKQLTEVSNERDVLAKQLSEGQDQAADLPELQTQLKEQINNNADLRAQLEEAKTAAEEQSTQLETVKKDLHSRLEESAQQVELMQEQATALKDQVRQLSESREAAIEVASASLKEKLQELAAKSNRTESIARSARASASKANAECQVLEGALEGSKAMLVKAEDDKLGLEAQIQQLMVEAERSNAEHTKKMEDLQKQLHESSLSPKSPSQPAESEKAEIAALRSEFHTRINVLKAREEDLMKELDELRAHSANREVEVDERVSQTQQELDVLLPELQQTQDVMRGSNSMTSLDLYEARQMIAEKDLEVQGLEDRVAQAESALNVATAHIEEQSILASPLSRTSPQGYSGLSHASLDAFSEPGIPDVRDVRSFSSRHSKEEQSDRIEKLESYVEQLEEEITALRKLKEELVEVKAEKDRVENAVRNYLAEKPAEDAMREKELQSARAETEQVELKLEEAKAQIDALKVQLDEQKKTQSHANSLDTSQNAAMSKEHQQEGLEKKLEESKGEVSRLTQLCSKLESQIASSEGHPGQAQNVEDVSTLKTDLEHARAEAAALQKQVSELLERQRLQDSAQRPSSGDPEASAVSKEAERKLQDLEIEIKDLKAELAASTTTHTDLENQVKNHQESARSSADQLESLKARLKSK